MYYDRDEASARAIAGLRCLELQGLGRPTIFRLAPRAQTLDLGKFEVDVNVCTEDAAPR